MKRITDLATAFAAVWPALKWWLEERAKRRKEEEDRKRDET